MATTYLTLSEFICVKGLLPNLNTVTLSMQKVLSPKITSLRGHDECFIFSCNVLYIVFTLIFHWAAIKVQLVGNIFESNEIFWPLFLMWGYKQFHKYVLSEIKENYICMGCTVNLPK